MQNNCYITNDFDSRSHHDIACDHNQRHDDVCDILFDDVINVDSLAIDEVNII